MFIKLQNYLISKTNLKKNYFLQFTTQTKRQVPLFKTIPIINVHLISNIPN